MHGYFKAAISWLKENAVGIVMVALTVAIYYERLRDLLQSLGSWLSGLAGIVAPFAVILSGSVALVGVTWAATRAATWAFGALFQYYVGRVTNARMSELARGIRALEVARERSDKRLDAVEERLRIGTHSALNLSDNLPPDVIRVEIQRHEREMGYKHLWTSVMRDLRATASGYVVFDYNEDEAGNTFLGSSHFLTRTEAEARAGKGTILVHVIASDWEKKNTHEIVLDIGGLGDVLDVHRRRYLDFMSVDHNADGSYTFRLALQEKGKDESTGRTFDWWFERLQRAVENGATAKAGTGPTVMVYCSSIGGYPFHQAKYEGCLRKPPRIDKKNRSLFEFDLSDVKATSTWRQVG